MQVVDTNRSKASFTRLNKQTLEGAGAKRAKARKQPTNKKETKRSIEGQHFESDFVQLSGCNPKGLNPFGTFRQITEKCKKSKWVEDPPTGGNDGEVPPVPIPNTVVKLSSAESTWLDTAREDRSLPVPLYSSVAQWQSTRLLTGLL